MNFLQRLLLYALLALGAITCLIPLLWMISTGLKPIEQTMSMPPTWIPYRLYVQKDGVLTEIQPADVDKYPPAQIVKKPAPRWENFKNAILWIPYRLYVQKDGVLTEIQPADVDKYPPAQIVKKPAPRWENFKNAILAMRMFGTYLQNTLILCVLTVIGAVASSALAAYGFSRIDWRGRDKMFLVCLATMMIPFPVVMVPVYCLFRWLGWIGTLRPLWVGSFFAGAFNVFLLRQFFMTIPKDLSEAARIDGCSEFRIFWQIILPLCRPALMVVALFQFMYTWNDFLGPLIFLTKQEDYTLALGLQFFQSQHGGTEWHYLMAASTLVALPIIVLFFFTQKTFIEGISMTGIKG